MKSKRKVKGAMSDAEHKHVRDRFREIMEKRGVYLKFNRKKTK